MKRKRQAAVEHKPRADRVQVRFGGWNNGDNHKPGKAWYFVCPCGHRGLGQLLPASAWRQAGKHVRRCDVAKRALEVAA